MDALHRRGRRDRTGCPGGKVYLACTDQAAHYRDMGALYQACKAAGADFEYRVLPTVGDGTVDAVRCIESLIAKIIY